MKRLRMMALVLVIISVMVIPTVAFAAVGGSDKTLLSKEWYLDLNYVYGWGWLGVTPAITDLPGVNKYGGEPNSDIEIVTGSDGYWSHLNPSISAPGLWRAIDSKGKVEWYKNTQSDESRGSIAYADLNGDGYQEFVGGTTSGHTVEALDRFGNFFWTFPSPPSPGGFEWPSSPAIADLNPNTSGKEVIAVHRPSSVIFVLDGDNSDGVNDGITFTGLPGYWGSWPGTEGKDWDVLWTYKMPGYDSHGSAAAGDVDNDGVLEVVAGASGGNVYILNGQTGALEKTISTGAVQASPALVNLDGDARLEIVVGSLNGVLYAFDWDGANLLTEWSKNLGTAIYSSASAGNLDDDSDTEVVVGTTGGKVYAFSGGGTQEWVYPSSGTVGTFYASPSLADRIGTNAYGIEWPMFRHDATHTGYYGSTDHPLDVYIGSMNGYLYLLDGNNGTMIDRFQTSGPIHGSPTIGDLDGDKKLNIVFQSWGQWGGYTQYDRLWNIEEVNNAPIAYDVTTTTLEDTPVGVIMKAFDADGDALTYSIVSGPTNGTLGQVAGNKVTYAPNANYFGKDSFIYKVSDGKLDSNDAYALVVINPVNDPPVANPDTKVTDEDVPLIFPASDLVVNDTDVDGDILVVTAVTATANTNGTVTLSNSSVTYAPDENYNGTASFQYKITDGNGYYATSDVTVTVNPINDAPVACDGDVETNEDVSVDVSLWGIDVDGDPITYSIVSSPNHGTLGILNGNTVTYTPDPNYNGLDSFTFKVNDGILDSNIATARINIIPVNDAPVIGTNSASVTVDEGKQATNTGTWSDVDIGDVVTLTASVGAVVKNSDGTWSWSFDATDGPAQSQTVTVTANDVTVSADTTFSLAVNNVAPSVGIIDASIDPVLISVEATASASFTDPSIIDTHTAVWDWGDGTTSAGVVNETNGSGSVTGGHTYASAGVYTVKLTVTDKDGASAESIYQYVVIYDPSAGFVTGGGWINSPSGAYTADSSLTGKAIFGFVSKYHNGTTTPSGQTEFQFKVANLNFHSTSYDWLVVAGHKAQYKGAGTINGTGDYGFMLTATDGQLAGGGGVDKFRMKIWDKATGNVVYDNQLGSADDADATTALSGGSIVIHN